MSEEVENVDPVDHCSFVSIHYIICECGETFPSEDALKTHLDLEHPHKKERKEYKCGICSEVYDTEDECIQHYEASHIPVGINLEHCEAEDSDEFDDDSKPCLEEGEVPPEALEEATVATIKRETLEAGEIPLESGEIPVFIDMPRAKAPRKGRKIIPKTGDPEPEMVFVIQHGQKRGQLVSMLKKSGRLPQGMRTIVCEICGKAYASYAALRYHQRTHTGERPYPCPYCPKAFTMPLFLQVHVRVHTGERPYQCDACPKNFSNKAALLRHNRVHTGEKPYQCPMCSKAFTQSNSMKLHVTTVHLKQPTPYKSRKRKIKAEERAHANKKTNPRTKPPCPVDSIEVLKSGLESYVLGPLKADLENLKADIDALATEELEDSSDNSTNKVIQKAKTESIDEYETVEEVYETSELNDESDTYMERRYLCGVCTKSFCNRTALIRHRRVHTGEKPYQCPMCSKAFTQSNSMKLHVTTVHLKQPTPYKSRKRKIKENSNANPQTKNPCPINSIDLLKSGMESYVLGPLKTDLENLKADIDALDLGYLADPADPDPHVPNEGTTDTTDRYEDKGNETMDQDDESESNLNVYYQIKDGKMYEVIEEIVYEDTEVLDDNDD